MNADDDGRLRNTLYRTATRSSRRMTPVPNGTVMAYRSRRTGVMRLLERVAVR